VTRCGDAPFEAFEISPAHEEILCTIGREPVRRCSKFRESEAGRSQDQRAAWVDPVLVAQIKFTEWTSDDQLRQPVFLGLRSDKQAKEVVRE